jgi:ribonuclease-3
MQDLPHAFRDPGLLRLALTHSSTGAAEDNERLEFLGDAALDLLVAEELFRLHPGLAEGALTELKAELVSRRSLAEAARALALAEHAELGGGLRRRVPPRSVLANLYEAVLGAIYLDGGLEAAREFVRATLASALGASLPPRWGANPKQALQEHCQGLHKSLPRYHLLEQRGEAHARAFLVQAELEGEHFPSAWGRTLKEAESWAAHEALLVIEGREPTR